MAIQPERIFKTAWFTRAARKARISDEELCTAIRQVMLGQADALGGGVYKKRLSNNQYRSIVLAKGGHYWSYTFLFAKQDRANISESELDALRQLARLLALKTEAQIEQELKTMVLMEICHEDEIQK